MWKKYTFTDDNLYKTLKEKIESSINSYQEQIAYIHYNESSSENTENNSGIHNTVNENFILENIKNKYYENKYFSVEVSKTWSDIWTIERYNDGIENGIVDAYIASNTLNVFS